MRVFTVADFKTHFSEILEYVSAGEQVGITHGRKKEIVALLVPPVEANQSKRPLGLLAGRARVDFSDDFKMTEEEFFGV